MLSFACMLFAIAVGGEHPVLKGTSYGYVPNDVRIVNYSTDKEWRPIGSNRTNSSDLPTDQSSRSSRYLYEPPSQDYLPPFGDEYPIDITTVPPSHDEGYNYVTPESPFNDLQPPVSKDEMPDPSLQYLPAVAVARTKNHSKASPLQLEVNEMNCYDTPNDGKFKAILTFKSHNENIPVFEDTSQFGRRACEIKSDSSPPRFDARLYINISKIDFQNCGVRDCSQNGDVAHLCVRLRFPSVARMRLPEDAVLTLQCRTRDRIAFHTKHLLIDVNNSPVARSNGVVARGGGRGTLRSRALLYRRGPSGDYTDILPPHARVPLGDTLMLKASIEPGDGWVSSRMSSVVMRGDGEGSEEVVLIQPNGCRSLKASVLCPRDPISTSPLAHTLLIRAAMFEGMQSGEEVRLSVRLVACLEANDCRPTPCNEGLPQGARSRRNAQTADSTSVLSFKVVTPTPETLGGQHRGHGVVIVMTLVLSATIVCSAALIFLKTKGQICSEGRTI